MMPKWSKMMQKLPDRVDGLVVPGRQEPDHRRHLPHHRRLPYDLNWLVRAQRELGDRGCRSQIFDGDDGRGRLLEFEVEDIGGPAPLDLLPTAPLLLLLLRLVVRLDRLAELSRVLVIKRRYLR